MSKHIMMPVIAIEDLEDEVKRQFDVDVEGELNNILFGTDYINDCYKRYYFRDDEEYHGYDWEDEEEIRICNLVNAYLRDTVPNYDAILIDVSW